MRRALQYTMTLVTPTSSTTPATQLRFPEKREMTRSTVRAVCGACATASAAASLRGCQLCACRTVVG
jgi:hypothetical protein